MAKLEGSETEKNLLKAFAGESQAKNRYQFFAKVARKEGYQQIANTFEETAFNEEQHAKLFFKFLEGRSVEITATYAAGKIGTTLENLEAAAYGEQEEWEELYPEFARVAKEEGFPEVAATFNLIAKIEKEHEGRYRKFYKRISEGTVFKRDGKIFWKCLNCGHLHEGLQAPDICPACKHPQAYFEENCVNY